MPDLFTIKREDDFDEMGGSGGCDWLLARKSLGLGSFGMNLVKLAPGGQLPEHNEAERDQEEVFIVLDGEGTMVLDGDAHPAPAGTYVRCDPAVRRTLRNDSEGTVKTLIVSAPSSSGFQPLEWA